MSAPITSVENLNVVGLDDMPSPDAIKRAAPLTSVAARTVAQGRAALQSVLARTDPRWFVVVGPCSVHDPRAALEYAGRLRELASEVQDTLLLVMRVYFEKPRTVTGWKGFINDPKMDDSFRIGEGMLRARELLLQINDMSLPAASEALLYPRPASSPATAASGNAAAPARPGGP